MHYSITKNTCFSLDGSQWSVMEYNCADKAAPIITACRSNGFVNSFSLDQFSDLYQKRRLQFIEVEGSNRPVSARIQRSQLRVALGYSQEELDEIDLRMGYVLAISDDKKFITSTKKRLNNIRNHALSIHATEMPSDATVRRWFARWRAANYENSAVLSRKGGNRTERLEKAVENFIQLKINDEFMDQQRISVVELYDRIRRSMKADPLLCKCEMPSLKTLYRRVKEIPEYDRVAARYGWDVAQQQFPSGLPVRQPRYPYERFELDHTPVDLIIVDDVGEPLGQAWVTFLIDAFTRMVVGFYISLKAPSRKSVVSALKHAITPKTYVKEKYPDIEHELPCWGVCGMIAVDNGRDLHANDAKRVLAELNITVLYCPRKRPNYKGKIERFLKRFNYEFIHLLPGTTFANYIKKGDYNKKSVITLPLLEELVHRWVIDDYHIEEHDSLGVAPLTFWNDHQHAFSNPVLFDTVDRLDQLMWVEFTGSIQKDGITKHNSTWNSKALQDIAKQCKRSVNVAVLLDEDNINTVQVRVPDSEELIEVKNTMLEYTDGLSLAEHKIIHQQLCKKNGERQKFSEQALMTARKKREGLVNAASEPKRKSKKGTAPSTDGSTVQANKASSTNSNTSRSTKPKSSSGKATTMPPITPDHLEVE